MKKLEIIVLAGLLGVLVAACGGRETHFMKDKAYREAVHADFEARMAANDSALARVVAIPGQAGDDEAVMTGSDRLSPAEREALEFLYAYMPLADAVDYPVSYFLDQVRATFRIREEMGWKVPEREFRHFVLPIRVNNENLDTARVAFNREIAPRVKGMSMKDAILEVNHWCHEKMTYQPSDARTSAPLASMMNALGRCGEESTFCVAALRSVGTRCGPWAFPPGRCTPRDGPIPTTTTPGWRPGPTAPGISSAPASPSRCWTSAGSTPLPPARC